MDGVVLQWLKDFYQAKGPFGRVLELGSLNVNGTARDAAWYTDEYVGMDLREGPGVDLVENTLFLQHQPHWKDYFDCVVATSFFEHDPTFWETMRGVHRVLKPGGYFVLTVPTPDFPYHAEPKDYWRFQADALLDIFFDGFDAVHLDNPLWTPPAGQEHLRCQHMGAWGRI